MLILVKRAAIFGSLFCVHAMVAASYHQQCRRTLWHTSMFTHSPICEMQRTGLVWLELGAVSLAIDTVSRQLGALSAALDVQSFFARDRHLGELR